MKKLFLFGAAAIAMLASCQKTEVDKTLPAIDDSKPVAMQFNVNAPSFEVTKTKAAVDEWNNTPIYVYGLQRGAKGVVTEAKYDFKNILINQYSTNVVNEETALTIYQNPDEQDEALKAPYFYAEGETYDFFGYHLGMDHPKAEDVTKKDDAISFPVTITGQEDLMVAAADKDNDIKADTSLDGVTTDDVYSAWAARRNVHPTLVFKHALTRFNFIVRGMNDKAEKLQITGIQMPNLKTTGTFTVVGEVANLGFVSTGEVVENGMYLPGFEEPRDVVKGNTDAYNECLMIAPDLKKVEVVVSMQHDTYPAETVKINPYKFEVDATQVLKDGVAAGIASFNAGTAYNIYINVYGPEEIVIKAELTEWADGGDYTYDPDQQRPGSPKTSVTAERTVEDNVIKYTVTYSSDITAIQGAIAKEQPGEESEAWQTLVDTRAETGISFEVPENENAEDYKLFVRYTTEAASEDGTTNWTTPAEPVKPAFEIFKSYLVVDNEESYNQLPESYRNKYGDYTKYKKDEEEDGPNFVPLPWLAVEASPCTEKVDITAENGDFSKTFNWSFGSGLFTIAADELGLEKLTAGTWTITVNNLRTKIVVPGVTKYGIVNDEKSYKALVPESYRQKYEWPGWTWISAHFTPANVINITATCEEYTWTWNTTLEEGETWSWIAIDDETMDIAFAAGQEWTITINGDSFTVTLPEGTKSFRQK